jgi:hypothetical protein
MTQQTKDKPKSPPPKEAFTVTDFEASNDTLKLFKTKGFFKKTPVLLMQIPIDEISRVESYRNELSVTWNGATNVFFKKNSSESFSQLRDKIRAIIDEHQEALQKKQISESKETDLITIINGVVPFVDVCFDVLMLLHPKRANWSLINQRCAFLPQNLTLTTQTLPPLTLDLSGFSQAVTTQQPEAVSKQAYSLLKTIHTYFINLIPDDEAFDGQLNFHRSVVLIDSYLALNDVFLGKTVGDKDNQKEKAFVETSLTALSYETGFKMNLEELNTAFARFDAQTDREGTIENTRCIFKQQLRQLTPKPPVNPAVF